MEQTLNPVLVRLFQKRGFSPLEVQDMLSWNLKDLPELTNMIDLARASERILRALSEGEKIGAYGDYDVDGTTSCALLWHFFKMVGIEIELFQPSRFVEGYGIHPSSIDNALEKDVKVLISVDCGITNTATADYANEKGVDLIITDHHKDAAPHIPRAYAVVNPCRRDEPEDSPLRALAGVGVAFALALQIKKDLAAKGKELPSIYPLLQFVAIGTISDLARMTPLNLRLTRHGLKQISNTEYPGIRAFFSPEELKGSITSERISFHVGPHINSKGRLDHPERALKLLIAQDMTEAREHFAHLEVANRDRKMIQAEVFEEAKQDIIKGMNGGELLACILYQPHWHEGVIGIVASKLVETFEVPAVVFTNAEEDGIIKASARSAGDLNMFELLQQCSDLFIKFGGHKAAAGLSMKKENFHAFKQRMSELLKAIPAPLRTKTTSFDVEVGIEEINAGLVRDLEKLEPFGPGHERPIFRMKNALIQSYRIMKDVHVRWNFSGNKTSLQGVSFNYIGKWNEASPDELFQSQSQAGLTVQFTLGVNRFNGNETIQLMVNKLSAGIV